jgi:hypothetical protein
MTPRIWFAIRLQRNLYARTRTRDPRGELKFLRWARERGGRALSDEYADDGDRYFDARELLLAEVDDEINM